ncbi:hypothetical protein JL49_23205 [Pseudoalteromonas luteoviolacea]|nr:hypothetical protein JL49_23205 [Pseudoalteromonas luteoviolacea]
MLLVEPINAICFLDVLAVAIIGTFAVNLVSKIIAVGAYIVILETFFFIAPAIYLVLLASSYCKYLFNAL